MNTPLTATMENEGDNIVQVRLKFADPTFTCPNEDVSCNNANDPSPSDEDILEAPLEETISIDLEHELSNNHFDNEHGNDENQQSMLDDSSQVNEPEIRTRTGRRIIKLEWHSNHVLLLSGLITSQFVNSNDGVFEINNYKHVSLFKDHVDYKSSLDTLFDGTSNSLNL